MRAAVVFVLVLLGGVSFISPVAAARPVSSDCPVPTGPSFAAISPDCGGGGTCTPVLVTVTAKIYLAKAQIDLDGVYLSNGGSAQYAAGCGETYALSVYSPATHYTFFQWVAFHGSVSNAQLSSTRYTPPDPSRYSSDTLSLILNISTTDASSSDWNYNGGPYLGNTFYEAGFQVSDPVVSAGNYYATGYFILPDARNPTYAPDPCQDPSGGTCYDEVDFVIGLGYPGAASYAGISVQISLYTGVVTLGVLWGAGGTSHHDGFPTLKRGHQVNIQVIYQSGTNLNYIYICDTSANLCYPTQSVAGKPDLSRTFYSAVMNAYLDIIWDQVPYIRCPVQFAMQGPASPTLNPTDRVLGNFYLPDYGRTTVAPSYTTTDFTGVAKFTLNFYYG